MTIFAASEEETRQAGRSLAEKISAGDIVLFSGELGAGKTTMIRGILEALGHEGPVRSPTFNLIQVFDTVPPVMHADLYRLGSAAGIGLEDYLDTHICLIEWPDRLQGLVDPAACVQIQIDFTPTGRQITVHRP